MQIRKVKAVDKPVLNEIIMREKGAHTGGGPIAKSDSEPSTPTTISQRGVSELLLESFAPDIRLEYYEIR